MYTTKDTEFTLNENKKFEVTTSLPFLPSKLEGKKIGECKFGSREIPNIKKEDYFISTEINAETAKEAILKGERRIKRVLSIFSLINGFYYYNIGIISATQIPTNNERMLESSFRLPISMPAFRPLKEKNITKTEEVLELFEELPVEKKSTQIIEKALNYFLSGLSLEDDWKPDSFLNYFKAVEIISDDFTKKFRREAKSQLEGTHFADLTEDELAELVSLKRLIRFVQNELDIDYSCDIPKIVTLRSQCSAHGTSRKIKISNQELNECKVLSAKTIIHYAAYLKKKES